MPDKEYNPPSFSIRLIKGLCKRELAEEIEGNLIEFYSISREQGKSFPLLRYWFEVFNYFRPSFLKLFKLKTQGSMFIFNPKIAVRNLIKHRSSTIISLLGFIVGLTSVIFLYFYVENELNYDAFHADRDQIYRLYRTSQDESGATYDIGVSSPPYAEALKNDFSSAIQSTLRVSMEDKLVAYGDKRIYEDHVMVADSNFFEFFSFPLKYGNPETVLDEMFNVVLSEELAEKYFGDENPIGKQLEINHNGQYVVAGIFSKPENKTHLEFDMVLSMNRYIPQEWFKGWWNNFAFTYIKTTADQIPYLNAHFPDFMEKYLGEDFKRNNSKIGLRAISLNDVHFHTARYDSIQTGSLTSVLIIASVAIAILFIACFNYINLSIAQSHKRAKEVGIRKVLGVDKKRLTFQFLGESIVILLVAITVACALSVVLRESLNAFFGLDVTYQWNDINVRYFFGALMVVVVLASGLYPALLLASFDPLRVLKSNKPLLGKNIFVRKGLIITQFSLSIFLIIVTMLIYIQIGYMNDKDLGYDSSAILIIDTDQDIRSKYDQFRQRLIEYPDVKEVTVASGIPSGFHDNYGIHFAEDKAVRVHTVFADPYYLKTFDIPVVAGRGFDDQFSTDAEQAMMISESAWRATGLSQEELIGKKVKIPFREWDRTVIGIFQDYHFKTLRDEMAPLAIIMGQDQRRIAIKMTSQTPAATVSKIEELYNEIAPSFPMKSWLLQEDLEVLYQTEDQQAKVFTVFSGISIGLACMGILGLAAFSAQQRQKELSIRKVLGASIQQVIFLISTEFLLLIGIAVVVAVPVSWYFMTQWLQDFAYRIDIVDYWPLFLLGGALTAVVAFLTIGIKTYKTAASNPAEIIKYE